MPLPIYVQPGAPSTNSAQDGIGVPLLGGKAGEAIVAELHGPYFTQTYRGNVFTASTATGGTAVGTATSTNCTNITLWNSSTTKVLEVIQINVGILSTIGIGVLSLSQATGLGTQAGTAAPVVSFSAATIRNSLVGSGNTSVATAASTLSLTTAPVLFSQLGFATQSSTAGTGAYTMQFYLAGALVLAPGAAITLTGNAATTAAASITWAEIPL